MSANNSPIGGHQQGSRLPQRHRPGSRPQRPRGAGAAGQHQLQPQQPQSQSQHHQIHTGIPVPTRMLSDGRIDPKLMPAAAAPRASTPKPVSPIIPVTSPPRPASVPSLAPGHKPTTPRPRTPRGEIQHGQEHEHISSVPRPISSIPSPPLRPSPIFSPAPGRTHARATPGHGHTNARQEPRPTANLDHGRTTEAPAGQRVLQQQIEHERERERGKKVRFLDNGSIHNGPFTVTDTMGQLASSSRTLAPAHAPASGRVPAAATSHHLISEHEHERVPPPASAHHSGVRVQESSSRQLRESSSRPGIPVLVQSKASKSRVDHKQQDPSHKNKKSATEGSKGEDSKCFDFGEYFGITGDAYYEDPFNFEGHAPYLEIPLLGQKVLCVEKRIIFFPCGPPAPAGSLKGTISIRNTSQVNMAYFVKCSKPSMLVIPEAKGYLKPKESKDVLVVTNPKGNYDFLQLSTASFLVLGIPVYFRCQLTPEKISILWDAYENEVIQHCNVESHAVRYIQYGHPDMVKGYSLLKVMLFDTPSPWPWVYGRLANEDGAGAKAGAKSKSKSKFNPDEFHAAWGHGSVDKKQAALLSEFTNLQLKLRMEEKAQGEQRQKRRARIWSWVRTGAITLFVLNSLFTSRHFIQPPFVITFSNGDSDSVIGRMSKAAIDKWNNWTAN